MRAPSLHVLAPLFACSLVLGLAACSGSDDDMPDLPVTPVSDTPPEVTEYDYLVTPELAVCPSGASFDADNGFCVTDGNAIGPFPQGMIDECERQGGGVTCQSDSWPAGMAKAARGEEDCPRGTTADYASGLCADEQWVYGPFDLTIIKECRMAGGGAECNQQRFSKWYAGLLERELDEEPVGEDGEFHFFDQPTTTAKAGNGNLKLHGYYTSQAGFMAVRRAARAYLQKNYGAFRASRPDRNACATYLSYALRLSQALPNLAVHPGTEQFRDAVRKDWKVVSDGQYQAGDVIISRTRKGTKDHPDHVYMFSRWVSGNSGMGYVVDNQATLEHQRNINIAGSKTQAAYALRDPNGDAHSPDKCGDKADGWYCSELVAGTAFRCSSKAIDDTASCGSEQICVSSNGKAKMDGDKPACQDKSSSSGSGASCSTDAVCNPGNEGSGQICTDGRCVAGCRGDYQCPGTQTCSAGQCGGASTGGGDGGTGTPGGGDGGADQEPSEAPSVFTAQSTGYYPSNNPAVGGSVDRRGARLRTLQGYLNGTDEYVSVAMDHTMFKYGTKLRIEQLEAKYGRTIEFRIVDTGRVFKGAGTSRVNVCVGDRPAALDASVNQNLTVRIQK